jgi:cellobionic acid phosphorylase
MVRLTHNARVGSNGSISSMPNGHDQTASNGSGRHHRSSSLTSNGSNGQGRRCSISNSFNGPASPTPVRKDAKDRFELNVADDNPVPLLRPTKNGDRYELTSPTAMPKADGFLWNQKMMIQVTCRGYATAQFLQPEPAKYAHAPNIEAKTFMQPEQAYYAHHPGRFVYIKDEESGELFSAPYEPCRTPVNRFVFSVGKSDIQWTVEHLGIRVELSLSLPTHDVAEMWSVKVTNLSGR